MFAISVTPKRVFCVIILMSVMGGFLPLVSYSISAQNSETLILLLYAENTTVVDYTVNLVRRNIEVDLNNTKLRELIIKILYSKDSVELKQTITSYIERYSLDITEHKLNGFIKYMDEKRIFYQRNYRSIDNYTEDYRKELSSIIGGTYMRIAGYPKRVDINAP